LRSEAGASRLKARESDEGSATYKEEAMQENHAMQEDYREKIMKKVFLAVLVFALSVSGASADSLDVNNTAALGGTGTACGGSNCGLEVTHDNSSIAFVQDDSPNGETLYRAEFLINVASADLNPGEGLRQPIFVALGNNPRPGVGLCSPVAAFVEAVRCFHTPRNFGAGTRQGVICWSRGDFCGERNTPEVLWVDDGPGGADLDSDGASKMCFEWESNSGTDAGKIRLGVVDDDAACSSATLGETNVTNNDVTVEFVRLGTPQLNGFGFGENFTYYFDEFASFRTVSP